MMGPSPKKATKRTSGEPLTSTSPEPEYYPEDGQEDGTGEDYKNKRARNNEAVKRSRAKTKAKVCETSDRVNNLKSENEELETKIKILSKELQLLKDMFVSHAGSTHGESLQNLPGIDNLLNDTSSSSSAGPSQQTSSSTTGSDLIKSELTWTEKCFIIGILFEVCVRPLLP